MAIGTANSWQLTPALMAEIQPYLSFDLSKVVQAPTNMQPGSSRYVVPGAYRSGQMTAPENLDVTAEYQSILGQIRSRSNPSIYGTAGSVSGIADRAFHDVYGGRNQASGGSALFQPGQPATFDAQNGVQYDAAGNPIARPQNQWGAPQWMQPDRPGFVNPAKASYADAMARQFQVDHPGYFQVGEDQNNKGSYDRGALDTNNLPASYFPNGAPDPNSMVKFDPKYGYIAPIALQKQSRPDFLAKYGQYIPLAFFGAGVAGSMLGGGLTQAAAPVSTGVPSSTAAAEVGGTAAEVGGSVGGGASGGAVGGGALGGAPAVVAPAVAPSGGGLLGLLGANGGTLLKGAGLVGGLAGAAGGGASGGGGYDGSASGGGGFDGGASGGGGFDGSASGGLGGWAGLLGQYMNGGGANNGGTLFGNGGLGGGGGSLLTTLLGAGVDYYQARQMADALKVQDKSTDYSKTSGGHTSFDPSIRGLQDQSLGNTAALESGVMGYGTTFRARSDESKGQYDALYRELTSNQNPYIQARVDPLKEQIASSRGQIQRNQGLRGVSGSSFGNDELTNFDFGAQRQLGDASSLATNDALGARSNTLGSLASLNQNRLAGETSMTNSLNTLNQNSTQIARDRASLERAGLGLSADSEAASRAGDIATQDSYGRMLQRLLGGGM